MTTISKKTKGRRKVPMVRMENDNHRQVTFSKRRQGLFKKANELCTLCAVEAVIIIFSPGGKAFSFGQPSVETIIKRLLDSTSSSSPINLETTEPFDKAHSSASVIDLNKELTILTKKLEMEKKRGEEIDGVMKQNYWWHHNIEVLTLEQLIYLKSFLKELSNIVICQENFLMLTETANTISSSPI